LEEQLEIITGLWDTSVGAAFGFSGKHYSLSNCPALPKPVQSPHPPIIVGGHGRKRTPRLAARFADEFNVAFASYDVCESQFNLVDDACKLIHRDPGSIIRSIALVVCCGQDKNEVERRASNIQRDVDELSSNGLAGSPAQIVDRILTLSELGLSRIYLQILDMNDLEHVGLIASEVLPMVKSI
jgi:alkanesulfonate monooxygenase